MARLNTAKMTSMWRARLNASDSSGTFAGRLDMTHVTIRGAFHYMFSDDGAVMKSTVVRGLLRVFGRLGMSGRRQLAVTAYCVRTFCDAYLEGDGASRPSIASPLYPEMQVLQ